MDLKEEVDQILLPIHVVVVNNAGQAAVVEDQKALAQTLYLEVMLSAPAAAMAAMVL